MNTLKHISLFVTLAATALLAACSDKDDYTPGPEVAQGCQQVRFLATNTADCIFDAADESIRSTTITLKRNNDGAALTMPIIIVSKDEGLEIPTEVTFPTGQSTAQITIKTPQQVKLGDSFAYEIKIEGDNIDPYAKLDGGATFAGTVNYPKKGSSTFGLTLHLQGGNCLTYGQKRSWIWATAAITSSTLCTRARAFGLRLTTISM